MTRFAVVVCGFLLATSSEAGIIVDLKPTPLSDPPGLPPGHFMGAADVTVDVFLRQEGGAHDLPLWFLQFDFGATDHTALLTLPVTDEFSATHFWDLSAAGCGGCYSMDDALEGAPQNVVSIEWQMDPRITDLQLTVPGDGTPVYVGSFEAFVPAQAGAGYVNILDPTATEPGRGAELRFGYDPVTVWRAETGDIVGGEYAFTVGVPEPSTFLFLAAGMVMIVRRPHRVSSSVVHQRRS